MQIHSYGVVSFGSPFFDSQPEVFPLLSRNSKVIAPFWDFNSATIDGFRNVLFRLTEDEALLNQAGSMITNAFGFEFSPSLLFIATWDRVELFPGSSRVNLDI